MARSNRKGVQDARRELPGLLAEALKGRSTVITRHGRSIAAIVPLDQATKRGGQRSMLGLAGSGRGLWGRDSRKTLRRLRDEWSR